MLMSHIMRNVGRCSAAYSTAHQLRNQLTPISSYYHQNFRRNDTINRKTGFLNESYSSLEHLNLHKAIHSDSASFLKYSNMLSQKVSGNEKIEKDDKVSAHDERDKTLDPLEDGKRLGLFARFKKMAKDYWYVLIPVHVATSCLWFAAFYYTSVSGFDIVGLMERYEFSETLIKPLRNSHLGHIAIAYFLYKVATPARYAVTLGGTTFAIKFLSQRGVIKPMPSKDKLVQIYKDKKDDLHQKVVDKKQELKDKTQALQDKYMKKD